VILNVAQIRKFSSDRAIRKYCSHIWKVEGIEEQTRKWADLKQDNLVMITPTKCGDRSALSLLISE